MKDYEGLRKKLQQLLAWFVPLNVWAIAWDPEIDA